METPNRPKVIITKGLPASGKSTFANNWVQEDEQNRVKIEKDDIRKNTELFEGGIYIYDRGDDDIVVKERDRLLHSALSHNKSVICSDTNLTQKSVNQIVSIAKEYDAEVEIKDFFDVSIKELIERDKNRPKSVGENKIRDLFYKHVKNMPTFVKFNPVLPFVVVCDLDGTLYLDETKHKLSTEDINIGVAHTLDGIKVINYCKVFILSTREASLTEQTEEWLERNSIEHDKLFTLEVDDESSEECKKAKFIEEQIIGKYNVLLWLDDDPQVCNMLRDVYGFNVAQLGDPNYRKKE